MYKSNIYIKERKLKNELRRGKINFKYSVLNNNLLKGITIFKFHRLKSVIMKQRTRYFKKHNRNYEAKYSL